MFDNIVLIYELRTINPANSIKLEKPMENLKIEHYTGRCSLLLQMTIHLQFLHIKAERNTYLLVLELLHIRLFQYPDYIYFLFNSFQHFLVRSNPNYFTIFE